MSYDESNNDCKKYTTHKIEPCDIVLSHFLLWYHYFLSHLYVTASEQVSVLKQEFILKVEYLDVALLVKHGAVL